MPATACITPMCRRSPPLPDIAELNIGHAIVAHAVFAGWENAVREMKAIMVAAASWPQCTMIYGIGTDIVQISRIEAALARHGERFAEKILGPEELEKYHARAPRTRCAACASWPPAFGQGSVFQGDRPGHAHADDLARRADAQRAERQADESPAAR